MLLIPLFPVYKENAPIPLDFSDSTLKDGDYAGILERLRGAMAAVENEQLFWLERYYRVGLSVCISELYQFSEITF
jgi:hypothetical protein